MTLGDTQIVQAENSVFQRRRTDNRFDESWARYVNAAQVVLGYFQDTEEEKLRELFDLRTATSLVSAARVLDVCSAEILSRSRTDEDLENAITYGELAAAAFSACGNFPAAETIVNRLAPLFERLSGFEAACLCCGAPALIGKLLSLIGNEAQTRRFAEELEAFLWTGEVFRQANVRAEYAQLRELANSSFDHALWLSFSIALEQCFELSTAKALSQLPQFRGVSLSLARHGIKTLLPPQYLAVNEKKLLGNRNNALLALPTSTGKTIISELAIFEAVTGPGRIGVFVVPYVALGRQVAARVSDHASTDWRILRLFGGFREPGALDEFEHKIFIVATPERLDGLLRFDPTILERIDCVVFDEAHLIENGQRGARVECLLARLLLRQSDASQCRIILASAVVPNVPALAKWADVPPENIVASEWSPNSKRIAVWRDSGRLTWYYSNDPIAPKGTKPDQPMFSINLPWPRKIFARRGDFAENRIWDADNLQNIAYLCHYSWSKFNEPVLCVCPTKEMTRKLASVLSERLDQSEPIPRAIQAAIEIIATRYPHYTHLKRSLEHGVAYHNASLPYELRGSIEDAANKKELRVILATTTLAEGVDLPFRVTVLADWLGYRGDDQVPLSPLLVRNIAGRCGRVGYFTEGDVIVYDNPLGNRQYKRPDLKEDYQRRIFFSNEDLWLQSAAAEQLENVEVQPTIASQFIAAIAENPGLLDIESEFVKHLFASSVDRAEPVSMYIKKTSALLTSDQWKFASHRSPLFLTELGEAANKSGLSPITCRRILDHLAQQRQAFDDIGLGADLLKSLGDVPEQPDKKFATLVRRKKEKERTGKGKPGAPRTVVRINLLPQILAGWLDGQQPIQIFSRLPTVLKSKRDITVEQWIKGTQQLTTWDAEFDKFCDFLRSTVFEFLPWLLRACGILATHVPEYVQPNITWNELAEKYHRNSTVTQREDAQDTLNLNVG